MADGDIMDENFWHRRWNTADIGFHQKDVNPLLRTHIQGLSLASGSRIFVPLCGKTLDIAWLLSNGYHVVGAELSELAIQQLFEELGVEPVVSENGPAIQYCAEGIDIFVGDIFDMSNDLLGLIHATYDRAAYVALPEPMRARYAAHLTSITENAPQLLIIFTYDQTQMDGPPFSIDDEEIYRRYENQYEITHMDSREVPGGLKGICAAEEKAWLLRRG